MDATIRAKILAFDESGHSLGLNGLDQPVALSGRPPKFQIARARSFIACYSRKPLPEKLTVSKAKRILERSPKPVFSTKEALDIKQISFLKKFFDKGTIHGAETVLTTLSVCSERTLTQELDKLTSLPEKTVNLYKKIKRLEYLHIHYRDEKQPEHQDMVAIRLKRLLEEWIRTLIANEPEKFNPDPEKQAALADYIASEYFIGKADTEHSLVKEVCINIARSLKPAGRKLLTQTTTSISTTI